jgi:hypothetical protein
MMGLKVKTQKAYLEERIVQLDDLWGKDLRLRLASER